MHTKELKFHHIDPVIINSVSNRDNLALFKVTQYYENNTNEDIVVVLRNNLPIKVPRYLNGFNSSKSFSIKTSYTFNSNSGIVEAINIITEILKTYSDNNEDLLLINKALLSNYNNDRHTNYCNIVIERTIDINFLKQEETVYMPECDVLVCFRNVNLKVSHPFSNNGQIISEYHNFVSDRKVSGVFVELIDNENNIGNRYMYVAKQLIEIPVRKDPNKKSGVYFTKATNDRINDIQIKPEFYEFDKSEDYLGLYKTKEEAMTGGNPDHISKTKLKQLEHDLLEARLDSERDKLERDSEISKLNKEVEKAKLETIKTKEEFEKSKAYRNNYYDSASQHRNDYYEQRSYNRKDAHEMVKYLPSIAIGIIGALVYVNSKSAQKDN
jgi:hypothetical protein